MSEAVQTRGGSLSAGRPPRAERVATSCGECRRRKQKCNQGQPCGNCARRFPQPACIYKSSTGKRESAAGLLPQQTLYPSIVVPDHSGRDEYAGISQPFFTSRGHSPAPAFPGEVVKWSGINIATQYPLALDDQGPAWPALAPWRPPQGGSPMLSPSISGPPSAKDAASPDTDVAIRDAFELLKVRHSIPNRFIGDWHPGKTEDLLAWMRIMSSSQEGEYVGSPPLQMSDSVQELAHLPMPATRLNAELLRIYVKLISRFKACVDGNPDASNRYVQFYVPYCIQTPLLAKVAIYTAACFLNETGHLDKMVAMMYKGMAIRMLNEHLRSRSQTSDEAITAVIQLIMDEWYWGETSDLRAHLRGLREMIRLRGGLRHLGMNGMISKLAVSSDIVIALSFEIPTFFQHSPEFEFQEAIHVPFRVAYNTPLVSPLVPFANCAEALGMHPATATILDDMRFLIYTVLSLSDRPTARELKKVHTTSAWIHARIAQLPADSPLAPKSNTTTELPTEKDGDTGAEEVKLKTPKMASKEGTTQQRSATAKRSTSQFLKVAVSPGTPQSGHSESGDAAPDFLYQAVRQTALLYSRAIMRRQKFSATVTGADFLELWTTTWRVSLTAWKGMVGVFMWILLAIVASGRGTPHDRFVKSMLTICSVQMSLESWEIASRALKAAVQLGAWLRGGGKGGNRDAVGQSVAASAPASTTDSAAMPQAAECEVKGEDSDGGGAAIPERQEEVALYVDTNADDKENADGGQFVGGGKAIREQGSKFPTWSL